MSLQKILLGTLVLVVSFVLMVYGLYKFFVDVRARSSVIDLYIGMVVIGVSIFVGQILAFKEASKTHR